MTLFVIAIVAIIIAIVIFLSVIVVKMANKRGRSAFGWFLLSLIISPFLCMLFLALLGETDEKREERIIEEEQLRNKYRNQDATNTNNAMEKWLQENPGKSVNDYYYNR